MSFVRDSFDYLFKSRNYVVALYICVPTILAVVASALLSHGASETVVTWTGIAAVLPLHFTLFGIFRLCRSLVRFLVRLFIGRCLEPFKGAALPASNEEWIVRTAAHWTLFVLISAAAVIGSSAINLVMLRFGSVPEQPFLLDMFTILVGAAFLATFFVTLLWWLDRFPRSPLKRVEIRFENYARTALPPLATNHGVKRETEPMGAVCAV